MVRLLVRGFARDLEVADDQVPEHDSSGALVP